MKRINIILSIICATVSLSLVSCSPKEVTSTPVSTTNVITMSDYTILLDEIDNLKKAITDKTSENDSLKGKITNITYANNYLNDRIQYLEKSLEEASVSPLSSNARLEDLLQIIHNGNSKVDIFPGVLQSIHLETTDEATYFVFSIDRMAVNARWDGPGSDSGRGYFINTKEKYQEYRGKLDTIFMYKGYKSLQEKQEAILAEYNKKGIYNFYMIGNEIVLVGQDPGP